MKENEPDVYENEHKLMLPKDYVRMKLTGEITTDVTDASGTLFLDVGARTWSEEMLGRLEVDRSILPGLVESTEITGGVNFETAEELGLRAGTPAVGVFYPVSTRLPDRSAGSRNSTAIGSGGRPSSKERMYTSTSSRRRWTSRQEATGFFIPYLSGERHPHTDPDARGAFVGFHLGHTKAHTIRSVMEGVAFSFRDCLEVIQELGVPIREIRATGGGAQSELWLQMQANVSGEAIRKTSAEEGGAAYGAAILSSVGAGLFSDVREPCRKYVRLGELLEVDQAQRVLYDRYFQFYRTLYPTLKSSYQRLDDL